MSISDYINNFQQIYQKLKKHKIELPSAVLEYELLKNDNLSKPTWDLTRATVSSITFDNMKKNKLKQFMVNTAHQTQWV